jgi:hypothetical protein
MSKFEEYANKYKHVKMERRDGILQFTLHTNGGPVIWDSQAHSDTIHALGDVARDRDTTANRQRQLSLDTAFLFCLE